MRAQELSPADILRMRTKEEQEAFLNTLSDAEAESLMVDWEGFLARPSQCEPARDYHTWMPLAGRGWGKTMVGAQWVRKKVCGKTPLTGGTHNRVALVAETAADARDVMVEGPSGLLAVHPKDWRPTYHKSNRLLTWPNGAVAYTYNAVEPDQLRGPQHDLAWGDELAKWRYADATFDQIQFGLRLGSNPQQLLTTTPRPIPIVRDLLIQSQDPNSGVVVTRGTTFDNANNLARVFIDNLRKRYEGTRLGRQEMYAELLDDLPGALWNREMFEKNRLRKHPTLVRIVVAVDPSGAREEEGENDDIGIVVAGLGVDGQGYLLEDCTMKGSPKDWGQRAIRAYHYWEADRIVAEDNFGGGMVDYVIKSIDDTVSYKAVKASRGKVVRAEPVAALYEQDKVHHVGGFPELEDQMCLFGPDGFIGRGSPDRADAAVWAFTELMISGSGYNLEGL